MASRAVELLSQAALRVMFRNWEDTNCAHVPFDVGRALSAAGSLLQAVYYPDCPLCEYE